MPKRIRPRALSPSRINFKRIDEATANDLLAQYDQLIRITAKSRAYRADLDDLIAVGQTAVLEAHVTYRDDEDCTRDTWTRKVIKWRIAEEAGRYTEALLTNPDDTERLLNGMSPAEQYDRAFAKEAIGVLDPREAAVMYCRLQGYSHTEIASQLGVSRHTVWRSEQKALKQLKVWVEEQDGVN